MYLPKKRRGDAMKKDTHLINIYLKIHNKRTLTMDDLRYLAQYAPDCFEKTCQNVVYNVPAAKPIMEPAPTEPVKTLNLPAVIPNAPAKQESTEHKKIEKVLENLKLLEANEFPLADMNADTVKNLLGNLYMELLFPHNDKDTFFNVSQESGKSMFDRKI